MLLLRIQLSRSTSARRQVQPKTNPVLIFSPSHGDRLDQKLYPSLSIHLGDLKPWRKQEGKAHDERRIPRFKIEDVAEYISVLCSLAKTCAAARLGVSARLASEQT
ncbi:hypothetical protein FLAG1_11963 [Fusarium langsethiae]|uniref:Uncharacterized protein n=1 Tax=Fusarium langsethiae TaxID=179993 RepID=A0A0M9EL75_FUSLA|nr:hypothetical protein FLAG1_11963 [Fusarium langsethiae]